MHKIFEFSRLKRLSQKIEDKYETEWFKFHTDLKWSDISLIIENIIDIIDNLYDQSIETSEKININTASYDELRELPSIGPVKANNIIKFRKYNYFKDIYDILDVSRIGEATFNNIKDLICV